MPNCLQLFLDHGRKPRQPHILSKLVANTSGVVFATDGPGRYRRGAYVREARRADRRLSIGYAA